MEKMTDWTALWRELVEIKARSQKREADAQLQMDFWRVKAREFDESVKRRWTRPDSSRDFVISQLDANATVLDIGAGTGAWAALLARYVHKVTAIEPSPAMIEVRMGIIGRTQGVNASNRPKPKKEATTVQMPALVMILALRSWSDSGGRILDRSVILVAAGSSSAMARVCGG